MSVIGIDVIKIINRTFLIFPEMCEGKLDNKMDARIF
jgi:hypothetical protein